MEQKRRMIEIVSQARREIKEIYASSSDIDNAIANKLIDNGAVILPCNIGDKVYWIDGDEIFVGEVEEYRKQKVYDYNDNDECVGYHIENYCYVMTANFANGWQELTPYRLDELGETIFFSKEAAEEEFEKKRKLESEKRKEFK